MDGSKVTLLTEIYLPPLPSNRTLVSAERASEMQEEQAKAIVQLGDLIQVPWGPGARKNIGLSNMRTDLPRGGELPAVLS